MAQRRQIRWQPAGAQALPNGLSQRQLGGPARPIIESSQTTVAGNKPEDLSHLHHGIIVFGSGGIGAENMFQPDPVVFLGVECVFDRSDFIETG